MRRADPTISGRMWRWRTISSRPEVLGSSRSLSSGRPKRPDPMAPPEDDAHERCTYVIALAILPARVVSRGERDARAPALKILAAGFPASRAAISVRRPPRWPRAGSPLSQPCAVARPHRSVGRADLRRAASPELACGLPSPEHALRSGRRRRSCPAPRRLRKHPSRTGRLVYIPIRHDCQERGARHPSPRGEGRRWGGSADELGGVVPRAACHCFATGLALIPSRSPAWRRRPLRSAIADLQREGMIAPPATGVRLTARGAAPI